MNVVKWCLNRPRHALIMRNLAEFTGLVRHSEEYKVLRECEVRKSEENVLSVIKVLENEYLNPFSVLVEGDEVYNLSSGKAFQGDTESLLNTWNHGDELAKQFLEERLYSNNKSFHDKLKRNKPTLFSNTINTVKSKDKAKTQVVDANRNIMGWLLSLSTKYEKLIDFSIALSYPLYTVPLSLAFPDGTKRQTQKSKLLQILQFENSGTEKRSDIIIVDLIAQYRCLSTNPPNIFEELIKRLLYSIPSGYSRVDLVADCYRDTSIKSAEREKRGNSANVIISSLQSKVPRDLPKFYSHGENKSQLIKLTFSYIKANPEACLRIFGCEEIILSGDSVTERITSNACENCERLRSNQEEADTKVILHAIDALTISQSNVCVRSPSGDTDIVVIALTLIEEKDRVLLDSGNGDNRKKIWLDEVAHNDYHHTLIGFHAFTGNDFVSGFFRKGKLACWKTMLKNEQFINAFSSLGTEWSVDDETREDLELFVCQLYSSKEKKINDARFELFTKKQKKDQLTDLSLLPPCQKSLFFHIERSNYVAKIWKSTPVAMVQIPPPNQHGWYDDCTIQWIAEMYPDNITSLLQTQNDEIEIYGEDDGYDDQDDY